MSEPRQSTPRRVTVELPEDLYASLYAAKIYFRRSLSDLMREGAQHVVQRYREQRALQRTQPNTPPEA